MIFGTRVQQYHSVLSIKDYFSSLLKQPNRSGKGYNSETHISETCNNYFRKRFNKSNFSNDISRIFREGEGSRTFLFCVYVKGCLVHLANWSTELLVSKARDKLRASIYMEKHFFFCFLVLSSHSTIPHHQCCKFVC